LCSSRKISIPLPQRVHWKFRGEARVLKAKMFKGKYEPKLEFPEGWGQVQTKKTSVGGVWIFSGTTH